MAIALVATFGCGPGRPALPRFPSTDSLAANERAVGVPYGRWVAVRIDGRPAAFEMRSHSAAGDRISWSWTWLDDARGGAPSGSGTTVERRGGGRVGIGSVSVEWSRGSGEFGWLYWPDERLEVYSRPFDEADAARTPDGGSWLRRELF